MLTGSDWWEILAARGSPTASSWGVKKDAGKARIAIGRPGQQDQQEVRAGVWGVTAVSQRLSISFSRAPRARPPRGSQQAKHDLPSWSSKRQEVPAPLSKTGQGAVNSRSCCRPDASIFFKSNSASIMRAALPQEKTGTTACGNRNSSAEVHW